MIGLLGQSYSELAGQTTNHANQYIMLLLATSRTRTRSHVEFISMRDRIWHTINKSGLD